MEQFEKNIKEKFNERKIQPSAQAWDKLEMMLNEQETQLVKKKSPRTYLFIAASILVFVSLGTFFFKMNSDSIEPNVIQIQPTENLVIKENIIPREEVISDEEPIQNKVISEPKISKTKSVNKAVAHLPKVGKEVFIESEIQVNKEVVLVERNEEIVGFNQERQDIPSSKVDPKKLLMVAEYEQNVEKSASQFKQMKHKFEEVKTALNNINQ